jgi:NOL1/NOP2/fmu family ribosome biogenesis protein
MRETLTIWNSKEARAFLQKVNEQWGCAWKPDQSFISNNQGKVFLITRDLALIDWTTLRISSVGMYVGEDHDGRVRLSIEGSQLIGPLATKNIIDVERETAMLWIKGHDIEVKGEFSGHVIVRSGNDYMGTGAYKEGQLLNHVPKARRLPEQA